MLILENIQLGFSSLRANPLRSILTLIGIAVGIIAVLYVVLMGELTKKRINDRLSQLGTNILVIRPGPSHFRGVRTSSARNNLTWDEARLIESKSEVITSTIPVYSGTGMADYQDKNWNTRISGTIPRYAQANNCIPVEGRFFTDEELQGRRRVCVLGSTVAEKLFEGRSPLGESILINSQRFDVIGLLGAKGEFWDSPDDQIFIPLTTAQKRLFGVDHLSMILAQLGSMEGYDEALFDIETILRRAHRLRENQENDFRVRRQDFFLSTIQETNTELANFIILIALVSLVVGGIGIANVMLVSVTERTREIGIRRAAGATRSAIMTQFLMEAMVLGTVGGLIGVLGGFSLNEWMASGEFLIPVVWIGYSLLICISVGLIAGFYPAYRAAKMNVIEALRYE
jgi:putative ABC transport system permease protein